jgi:hypothetical protein
MGRKRAFVATVIIFTVLLFIGVAQIAHRLNQDRQAWRRSKEDDVRETVLHYEMAFLYQSQTYFIETGTFGQTRTAPSPVFMRRFQNCVPLVLPLPAQGIGSVDAHGQYSYHGKTAAVVSVGTVHWNYDGSAEVDGGAQCGGQCGTYGVFHVVCHHADWYVTDYEQQAGI